MQPLAIALTVFTGRVGDHNRRAMSGSAVVGSALADRLGLSPVGIEIAEFETAEPPGGEAAAAAALLEALEPLFEGR